MGQKTKPPLNPAWEARKEAARNADLIEYFQKVGFTLDKVKDEFYVKEVKGLCINSISGAWYSHYIGDGGKNSVDCLTKVFNRDFKSAVEELTPNFSFQNSENLARNNLEIEALNAAQRETFLRSAELKKENNSFETSSAPKKDFVPPIPNEDNKRVFAYLTKTRKIPPHIVNEFIKNGKLFQEKGTGNAVFPHKKFGKYVGAEKRGTYSFGEPFKGIAEGTRDSVFSYSFGGEIKRAFVFESGIDLMSFYAMTDGEKNDLTGTVFISMAGLKPNAVKEIEASGIEIISCVDNDEAGKKFELDNGFNRPENLLDKTGVKDWNDLLIYNLELEKNIGKGAPISEKNEAEISPISEKIINENASEIAPNFEKNEIDFDLDEDEIAM